MGTKSFSNLRLWCTLCQNSGGAEAAHPEGGAGLLQHPVGVPKEPVEMWCLVAGETTAHVPFS